MTEIQLARFIKDHQIKAEIVHLADETPTVEAAAAAVGVLPEQIGKSVLFLAAGQPILVIANGTTRIAYKQLADFLGISRRQLKLANPQEVLEITGYPVGTVPPFGHPIELRTLMHTAVLEQSQIYVGGGAINALVRINVAELQRVAKPVLVPLQE